MRVTAQLGNLHVTIVDNHLLRHAPSQPSPIYLPPPPPGPLFLFALPPPRARLSSIGSPGTSLPLGIHI